MITTKELETSQLLTERRNSDTANLDSMSALEIIQIMNREDALIAKAIEPELAKIAECITLATNAMNNGGRLIYMGAGTSGRLGLLDAVECPPTFSTNPGEVIGLLAGGEGAFVKAVEGAEDRPELGRSDLEKINLNRNDFVVGLAASGRTPYVIGGLEYAKLVGCSTASISCNKGSLVSEISDVAIEVDAGAEVLTGSTRLKSGTAQKMILNMISTATMVGLGKVYGNYMIDVKPTNEKLYRRSENIIMDITGVSRKEAGDALRSCDNSVKAAVVMLLTGCTKEEAFIKLTNAKGFIRLVISQEDINGI